ncbi:hypothetical protein GCM10025868_22210 [Angustibacter aerolatus]|uniref:Uncharacterized protein n=1 Tax=Angustibacter aerolatus TaxID=1162965 RepID=A0ABQ6JHE3_9ACTN|nr:hypothetical protein GCM10025868_22210 [Angustibacter aerolatus]
MVRSAQFHDMARQALGWGRDAAGPGTSQVPALRIQPIAVPALVQPAARGRRGRHPGDLEVAGPRVELLPRLSAAYAATRGDDVRVVDVPAGEAVDGGVLLPGADALLAGPTFAEWLAGQPTAATGR